MFPVVEDIVSPVATLTPRTDRDSIFVEHTDDRAFEKESLPFIGSGVYDPHKPHLYVCFFFRPCGQDRVHTATQRWPARGHQSLRLQATTKSVYGLHFGLEGHILQCIGYESAISGNPGLVVDSDYR